MFGYNPLQLGWLDFASLYFIIGFCFAMHDYIRASSWRMETEFTKTILFWPQMFVNDIETKKWRIFWTIINASLLIGLIIWMWRIYWAGGF